MTDYGMRKKSRGTPLGLLAVVFLVILLLAGGHFALEQQRPKWIAEASHWVVKGPPCTAVTAAAFKARGTPVNETFQYDDAVFARAFGQGSCAQIHKDGGRSLATASVCQFSSPTTLSVHTGKGDTFYVAEVGKPIAVTVDHGEVSCVQGQSEFPPAG